MEPVYLSDKAIDELKQFVDQVEQRLLDPANVRYFKLDPEQLHEEQINGFNSEQLSQVATKPGVYAIWIKTETTTAPQYIGHTAGATARNRLTNHFFKKHPRTGSQLENVKKAVADGHTVGFTFVALHPPLIRLYVESDLIARHRELCIWNIHSKGPKRKSTTSTILQHEQNV